MLGPLARSFPAPGAGLLGRLPPLAGDGRAEGASGPEIPGPTRLPARPGGTLADGVPAGSSLPASLPAPAAAPLFPPFPGPLPVAATGLGALAEGPGAGRAAEASGF